jgi:predicted esterase
MIVCHSSILVADDDLIIVALLDHLKNQKTSVVGWSDGAIIMSLNLLLHHQDRLNRVFSFA